jgi:hypothetical protein
VGAGSLEVGSGVVTGDPDGLGVGVGAGAAVVGAGAGVAVRDADGFGDDVAARRLAVDTGGLGATSGIAAGSVGPAAEARAGGGASESPAVADAVSSVGRASPVAVVRPPAAGGGPDIATASGTRRAAATPPPASSRPMAPNATRDERRRGLRCRPTGI